MDYGPGPKIETAIIRLSAGVSIEGKSRVFLVSSPPLTAAGNLYSATQLVSRSKPMKIKSTLALVAVCMALTTASAANAVGCLKGAVVGGVAGHYAGHHAVVGAVGGCLVGHHLAKEKAKAQAAQAHAVQQGAVPAPQ